MVYALLSDRKAATYVHLFNVLMEEANRMNKKFDPQLIMADFEPGIAKAIALEVELSLKSFENLQKTLLFCFQFSQNTVQKGCFFHFTQNIYKHVTSLGLSKLYADNIMIRSVIRQMMALALVPEEFVPQLFANLDQELTESDRLDLSNLFKYFNNQWMRNLGVWNVFNVPDRTNNYSEGTGYLRIVSRRCEHMRVLGYNNRFKKRLQKNHPNIWLFIDSIRKEVDTIHDLISQIHSGMQPNSKRKMTNIVQRRMEELYERFNNRTISIEELLRGLSLFVAHKK